MRALRSGRFIGGLILALLATACTGPRVRISEIAHAPALPPDCEPTVIRPGSPAPSGARLLREVRYGDTGFSIHCDEPEIREKLRRLACSSGADAVRLVSESRPSFASTCYRIVAELYELGQPLPAGTVEVLIPRPEYSDE